MTPDFIDKKYIKRDLEDLIYQNLDKGKAIILYGPRRAGKTTLIKHLFQNRSIPYLYLNCRERRIQEAVVPDSLRLKAIIGKHKNIVFDEAQYLEAPGEVLSLLTDVFPGLHVVASGSSSFELSGKVQEPVTGRNLPYYLFPLTYQEIGRHFPATDITFYLDQVWRFGAYPEVFRYASPEEKIHYLQTLTDDYLYKDILEFERVKQSKKLRDLLIVISLQLGSEVSYNELATTLSVDRKTIEYFIDLLEKTYVLFRLYPFRRNLRSEINKKVKIYFYDNGVRNALINNFNPLHIRADSGALFENYFISEMVKQNVNKLYKSNFYFWRTYTQREIDLIEEREGKLSAYECKYSDKRGVSKAAFHEFQSVYPDSTVSLVSPNSLAGIL